MRINKARIRSDHPNQGRALHVCVAELRNRDTVDAVLRTQKHCKWAIVVARMHDKRVWVQTALRVRIWKHLKTKIHYVDAMSC